MAEISEQVIAPVSIPRCLACCEGWEALAGQVTGVIFIVPSSDSAFRIPITWATSGVPNVGLSCRLTAERNSDLHARPRISICQPQHTTKFLYPLAYTSNADANATGLQLRDTFGNSLAVIADCNDQLAVLPL